MPIGIGAAMLISSAIGAGTSIASSVIGSKAASSAANTQATAAQAAGQKVVDAADKYNPTIQAAADKAAAGVTGATQTVSAKLDPYADLGVQGANAIKASMSDITKANPTMADLQIDPGYAFRLAQGQKMLQQSAAARGSVMGGGTQKAMIGYGQQMASDEYSKAFERYREGQSDRFSRLTSLVGTGKSAAETQGTEAISGAEYAGNTGLSAADTIARNAISAAGAAGDYLTQGANAKAAGTVGSSNAITAGLTGAGSSVANALLVSKMLQSNSGSGAYAPGSSTGNTTTLPVLKN